MSLLVKLQNVSNRGDGNTWIKLHISQFVYWGNHKLKPDCCSENKSKHTNRYFWFLQIIMMLWLQHILCLYLIPVSFGTMVPICPRVDGPLNSLGVSMGSWILWSSSRFSTSSASQRRSFARVWYGFGMFVAKWSARCCQTWKIITYV